MTELDVGSSNVKTSTLEMNNNNRKLRVDKIYLRQTSSSGLSVSSASSASDTSEDVDNFENDATKIIDKKIGGRKFRSMSDGQAGKIAGQDFIDVFPSLPDSVLEKLGLLGEGSKDKLNEEEVEQKFISLALAFTIDSTTIKDRCERQRRYRDQTESNLLTEIDKLIEKITFIQPLFVDTNTAELLAGLLAQIDVLIKAASHAAISAERYGAVQHEEKLSDAVNLMINHVTFLKQQRDSAKKQLQYTKRVLQDTNSPDALNKSKVVNGRVATGRRASIATVTQTVEGNKHFPIPNTEVRKITRRTSDLSTRISTFARSSRSSRLEFGVDLDKIKEGIASNNKLVNLSQTLENEEVDEHDVVVESSFKQKFINKFRIIVQKVEENYERRTKDGTLHEFFYFGSIFCFTLGVVILGNLLIEFELGKVNAHAQKFSSWNYLFKLVFEQK